MNTLKFLAVGSSLDAGREVVGRYRLREAGMLPRFESEPPSTPASWWRRLMARLQALVFSPPMAVASPLTDSLAIEPAVSGKADLGAATGAGASPVAAPSPESISRTGNTTGGQLPKPFQHEFRFASVTVVCNDLHDADIEIVSSSRRRRMSSGAGELREIVNA